jgi:fructose-1,6-bisphosphatase I
MTCNQFIAAEQRDFPRATGEFSEILTRIVLAAKIVSREVNKAGLLEHILGSVGRTNIQGEEVQKLDVYANHQFIDSLSQDAYISVIASEEHEELIHASGESLSRPGKYAVALDPLDGSSNIDVNVSIGTIFSIHKRVSRGLTGGNEDVLQPGSQQLAAGYVIYGSSTMLVYTVGRGVHGFTLDPSVGEFLLSHFDIKIPPRGSIYSVNEGNFPFWSPETQKWVKSLKNRRDPDGKPYSLRYIGSLVADFHRTLFKGGIFAYPLDYKDPQNPRGKLRLLYEAAPTAMIAEQAGGKATDGQRPIIDIEPEELHQRVPLFIGSCEDVDFADSFHSKADRPG